MLSTRLPHSLGRLLPRFVSSLSTLNPEPTKPKAEKSERTQKIKGLEDDIIAAFTKKDITAANDLIKAAIENKTLKNGGSFKFKKMLEKCGKSDFAEGLQIAAFLQNSYSDVLLRPILAPQIVERHTRSLMLKFADNNDMQGCQDFFDSINDDQKKYLTKTLEISKMNVLMINDEPAYLDLVRKDPIKEDFGLWSVSVSSAVKAKSEFIAEMKNLAKENNLTAQFVLMRIGRGRKDEELVNEIWGLVQDKAGLVHHFFRNPSMKEIKLISETLKQHELAEAMKIFLNNSNRYGLSSVVNMVTILSNNGGRLEDLETYTLRSLSNSKEFKEKALAIMYSREESPSD